jgi:1-acyl-sn-glycerol-3-phosphate acyltransferase
MIQDVIGTVYLFWPVTVLLFILVFLAGFLFAVSLGGLFAIGLLMVYYLYIYLKKRGIFDRMFSWLQKKNTILGEKLKENIRETFVLRGAYEKIPEGPVLYVAHPHGLFSMAPFIHWAAEATTWPGGEKVHIAIHSIFFRIPFVRELCEHFGAIEATDDDIRRVLTNGESVALLTGGVQEIGATSPGRMRIYLKKRKGFARIAKELGVPIVPVLTFGENELFPPLKGFWTDWVQSYMRSWLGIAVPLPTFESFRNWFHLLRGPLPVQVETWIGEAVQTDHKKSIETIRKHIFSGFCSLYREGKPVGYPNEIEIL